MDNNIHLDRARKTLGLHQAMEMQETLKILQTLPGHPESMEYFYEAFRNQSPGNAVLPAGKRIGTLCVQVPDEIIYGCGGVPVRLCNGSYAMDQAGADLLPAKSCSLIKATLGRLQLFTDYWQEKLEAIVVPTTCDLKKKAAEIIEDLGFKVIRLEFPSTKESELSRMYWQESVTLFARQISSVTGTRLTSSRLIKAIAKVSRANELFRKLTDLRKAAVPVLYGTDALLVTTAFFFDSIDNWIGATERLIDELEARHAQNLSVGSHNPLRILLSGSPPVFPNLKIPLLIEQNGAVIVTDEVCSGDRQLHDSISYDSKGLYDLVPAVADRYLKPCTCPCLVPNQDRSRRLIEQSRNFAVDGIIYQALSGCLPFELEQRSVSRIMAGHSLPMLYLETDYSPEDFGQLTTRIEAFMESIHVRKRKKR